MENESQTPETKPTAKPAKSETEVLRGMVIAMQDQIAEMKQFPRGKNRVQKREKDYFVFLREYEEGGEVKGIVTRIYGVKEVKDVTEAKRLYGVCSVDYYDVVARKHYTAENVDYLNFLNEAKRVQAAIISEAHTPRIEVDPRKGGGGVGAVYKQGADNEYLVDSEYEYEVQYVDHAYMVKPLEGKYIDTMFEVTDSACNL